MVDKTTNFPQLVNAGFLVAINSIKGYEAHRCPFKIVPLRLTISREKLAFQGDDM